MRRWAAVVLIAFASCAQPTQNPNKPPSVFLIVMENHSASEALSQPYTASLAREYGVANNYHAITHPSVPNYLALTSGSTWGVTDDSYHVLPARDLGTELNGARIGWRAYMEGLTSAGCLDSPLPYDPGHNPFAFYGGSCPENVVPLTRLAGDINSWEPRFVWITPNVCHDTHSCDLSVGDSWLHSEVGQIIESDAWQSGGVVFVTWDEDDGTADNHVLTLVVAKGVSHRVSKRAYTHYSLLATIEDMLGVARLGHAVGATPMTDLLPT